MRKSRNIKIRDLTITAILGAISILLSITPLGFIPLGPVSATTMHIPVIIGALTKGPIVGTMVGLIFGISSTINAILKPTAVSFVFLNPIVAILPRVLIGLVSYYSYELLKNIIPNKKIRVAISSVLGSLTNTLGVLSGIYFFHGKKYATTLGITLSKAKKAIITVGLVNGIPESIIAALIVVTAVSSLAYINRR